MGRPDEGGWAKARLNWARRAAADSLPITRRQAAAISEPNPASDAPLPGSVRHWDAEHRREGDSRISERPAADDHGLGLVALDAGGDGLSQSFDQSAGIGDEP